MPERRMRPARPGAKACDAAEHVARLRAIGVTPHVAQNTSGRRSAIDGRTTRHPGYRISQRLRKRIEEPFGWLKSAAGLRKTRYRGLARVGSMFTLTATASNLVRPPAAAAIAPLRITTLMTPKIRPSPTHISRRCSRW